MEEIDSFIFNALHSRRSQVYVTTRGVYFTLQYYILIFILFDDLELNED